MKYLLLLILFSPDEKLIWHKVTIDNMANTVHTHVQLVGIVKMAKKEADGDLHIKICDPARPTSCLVTESVPWYPLPRPKLNSCVTVFGIARYDRKHLWPEIHPIYKWEYASSCSH